MKALTVRQPYAHLIAIGEKRVENRSRQTGHRGPLVIHAGKSRACITEEDLEHYPGLAFGALIGRVDLVACLRVVDLEAGDVPSHVAWVEYDPHVEGHGAGSWSGRSRLARRFPGEARSTCLTCRMRS